MASSLKAPEPFSFSSPNLAAEWKMWRPETDEEVLVGVLITLLGVEGLKIFDTFVFATAGDEKKIKPVLDKFDSHFEPLKSEVFERGMVKGCNYGTSVESVLRDQVVLGVADTQTREKLLFEKSLDLAKACDFVRACEASRAQLTQMTSDLTIRRPDDSVNRLAEKGVKKSSSASEGARPKTFRTPAQKGTKMQLHSMEGVPSEGTEEHSLEEYVFHELRHERRAAATVSEWSETLSVDGISVTVKLDSGASCNVLPQEVFRRLPTRRQRLRPGPRVRRYGAKNGYLSVLGVHTAKVVVKGSVHIVDFVVVNEPGQPSILGLPSCQSLDLIRRVNSIETVSQPPVPAVVTEFLDVFTGLGKLPIEHVIKLSTGSNAVEPVVSPAGRIPFRLEEPVYRKLDQMVADGIIAPVSEPTDWVSRMMVVSKPDGDVRICIDPSGLNKAVLRQHYSIPTVEQLFAKIGRAKFFCSLDAAQGFYQIPLSEESSYLCTMATPRGRYRFLRMPFGLKSAPEVYLHTMSELFGDLTGVIIYFDDFLVTGESMEELQTNLRQVLTRCRQHNLKLQLKKCKFFLKEVPWLGHVIGDGVVKVDPSKVEAIVNMPEPPDKAALIRLLGMATYLDKFCQNLAGLTRPLRDLLKESSAWVWEEPQKAAWVKLKEAMSSLPALRRFDLDLPVMDGIHFGHFGEVKCVRRAKSSVYWPGCDDQIRNMVASCPSCQENRHKNPALPLFPTRIPVHPFQKVSADIFQFGGVHYLLLVDEYSKWPCVATLRTLTSSSTIEALDGFFADFGTPEQIISDNGKQFDCVEFNRFCAKRQVRHLTSSPEFPQSNGLAERHIQTVKKTMLKMFRDGKTLWEVLAAVRSTPVSDQLPSPSVLLQGRHLRGSLPFLPSALTPRLVPSSFVQLQLRRRQGEAHLQNTRCTDARSSALVVGQRVRARVNSRWQPGIVEKVCVEPNSYMVRLSDGRLFRRTRWAINIDHSASSPLDAPSQPLLLRGTTTGALEGVTNQSVLFPSPGPTHSVPAPATPLRVTPSVSCDTPCPSSGSVLAQSTTTTQPEGRSNPSRDNASPLAVRPAYPSPAPGPRPERQAISGGACGDTPARSVPAPMFTRSGRQFSRPVDPS
ncbi:putative uncharacterized protein K02A2.6-like [Daphnia sinensis]|uniref:RNA-directed DNA polymerase n=1 Tax=Daphnia sinensis TaxID=1820382 RepID=A0AAD5L4Z4_9CRUS|nr:putative uncharacterized protein K02A2.6-like [Daphnia sinensis]